MTFWRAVLLELAFESVREFLESAISPALLEKEKGELIKVKHLTKCGPESFFQF